MSTRIAGKAAAFAALLSLGAMPAFAQAEGGRDVGSYLGGTYRMEHGIAGTDISGQDAGCAPTRQASRTGNIWDFQDHQPRRADVQSAEQAAGVGLSPRRKLRVDRELRRLDQSLLGAEGHPQ